MGAITTTQSFGCEMATFGGTLLWLGIFCLGTLFGAYLTQSLKEGDSE